MTNRGDIQFVFLGFLERANNATLRYNYHLNYDVIESNTSQGEDDDAGRVAPPK
jgi:hypothetical protein